MKLFVSDLDNTLIYSYKRDIGEDKVLVETKEGKELSFMTGSSHRMLAEAAKRYCFVPSTTRSLEQYRRIQFYPGQVPALALVANGGILLRNGQADAGWYRESRELCGEAEAVLKEAEGLLRRDPGVSFEIRRVDGLFVFTKSGDVTRTMELLRENLDPALAAVFDNGSKVYVLPKKLSKGAALIRLRDLTGAKEILAAGDSAFDLSMLREADEAWIPRSLMELWDSGQAKKAQESMRSLIPKPLHIVPEDEIFSDRVLTDLTTRSAESGDAG